LIAAYAQAGLTRPDDENSQHPRRDLYRRNRDLDEMVILALAARILQSMN
jgi:hypothetical protein